jgi:hypothetical protein
MSVVALLIWLIIIGVLIAVVYFVVDTLSVPDPLNRVIKVVAVVAACLVVVLVLLQMVGVGNFNLNLNP